jgi:putative spermidine/putrescine transport system substrate-binding protein
VARWRGRKSETEKGAVEVKTSAIVDDLMTELAHRRISRREFGKRLTALGISARLAAAAAATVSGASAVKAQDKPFSGETLRVQFWSGPEGDNIQRNVVDPFVEETGAEVIVEYGFTSGSIAKVRAQAADPQLDVVLMDDIGVLTVAPEGLLTTLDLENIPNAADVDPRFIVADGQGIGFFTYVDTLLYNTAAYPEPPTTWRDLWAEDLRNKASVPTSNQTPALHMIIAAAILAGGDQMNPDPGFALLEELRPNIRVFAENTSQIAELMKGGDIELLSWTSYIFRDYMQQDYPIENTFALEEGVFATPACAAIPANHPGSQEVAEAFVNKLLEPAAQVGMAEGLWFGPTNSKAEIPPDIAKRVITFADLDNTIPVDLAHLLEVREDWITRYDRALIG